MSKLTISLRTKGKAVAALLKLYKAEPNFVQELENLRTNYLPVLEQWLKITVPGWLKMRETLTQEEFLTVRDYFLTEMRTISSSLADKLGPICFRSFALRGIYLIGKEKILNPNSSFSSMFICSLL